MPDLIKARTPRARKPQWCNACQAYTIAVGHTYRRNTYTYDGRVYDWPVCQPCGLIVDLVYEWSHQLDAGITGEDFQAWAEEHRDHPTHGEAALAYLVRAGDATEEAL